VFEGLKGKGGGKGFSLGRKKSHIKLK
jgi:hypothetical protein